jgi:hypothetical protein
MVRNLAIFSGGVIVLMKTYAFFPAMPWSEAIPSAYIGCCVDAVVL